MNTPAYIVQRNNQLMVDLRPLHSYMGFSPSNFTTWSKDRFSQLGLQESKDFEASVQNNKTQYLIPLPGALRILETVPKKLSEKIRGEVFELMLNNLNQAPQTEDNPEKTPVDEAPKPAPLIDDHAPIQVLRIEGRAAVRGVDLFRFYSKSKENYTGQWLREYVDRLGIRENVDFVSYRYDAGKTRKTLGYIVSIDAAILIANAQRSGVGRTVAAYLENYRDELQSLKLPSEGSLFDFADLESGQSKAAIPQSEEGQLFSQHGDAALESDHLNTPNSDSNGEASIQGSKTYDDNSTDGTPVYDAPESESESHTLEPPQQTAEETATSEAPIPPASELLLKSAQLLLQMAHVLVDQERKLGETRQVVGQMVAIGQQSAQQTLGLFAGNVEPPQQTLRSRIRQAVNDRCRVTGEDQEQVYAFIYNRLYYIYGINVNARERRKDETYLALCERTGALDRVYTIVTSDEFTAAIRNAPIQPKQQDQQS